MRSFVAANWCERECNFFARGEAVFRYKIVVPAARGRPQAAQSASPDFVAKQKRTSTYPCRPRASGADTPKRGNTNPMPDLLQIDLNGLYCPAGDFYIDPWNPVDRAVI